MRRTIGAMVVAAWTVAGAMANAQTQEVTIPYLRAAIGSIDYGDRVSVRAVYDGVTGMQEATGRRMRGKGYSRFTIVDPQTGVKFDQIYCPQDSRAFAVLLQETRLRPYLLTGAKDRGEDGDDAIIITEARALPDNEFGDISVLTGPAPTFRLVITDVATSNRTIIANVELGKPYSLPGSVLTIEREPQATVGGVHVVPAAP